MNKQMKNILWLGIMILLFSACGQVEATPASAEMPAGLVTVQEIAPTAVPANGSDPEKFSKYMGLSYPPLPTGLSEGFSMMIQDSNDYGLWLVSDDESRMLWLGKLTHHDASGNAYWEVKDILDLSNLESGVMLIPDGCLLDGAIDHEIFAAGKDGKTLLAWRANTALEKFEAIPTNGIECHSDKGWSIE